MPLPFEEGTTAHLDHDILRTKGRNLPHWTMNGAVYFITFRLLQGALNDSEISMVLQMIQQSDPQFYNLHAATIMPDHVHLLLELSSGITLPRMMKGMKGTLARRLNILRSTQGSIWQDEWYDRIVRNDQEYENVLAYMLNNPVKAGLVEDGRDFIGWYFKGQR